MLCASLAHATTFSLEAIHTPTALRNDGQLVLAVNAGGEPIVVNGIAFDGQGFGFDPPTPLFDAQWVASGDDFFSGFAAGDPATAGLDALFADAFVGAGTRTLLLALLTPGERYTLQLLVADDAIAPRAFDVTVEGDTYAYSRAPTDPAHMLVAEFVATAPTTEVRLTDASGGAGVVLNALTLHQVPEPGAATLVAIGALAWLARRRRAALAVFLFLSPCTGRAGLEWERTVQEFQATPAQEKVSAIFPFKNTGSTPVTIASIRTSCGCTAAQLEKRDYAPGEAGEIVAEFRFGGRVGHQEKTVSVVTGDAGAAPVELRLKVEIEEPLKVLPSLVFWRLGEAPTPKRIDLRAAPGRQMRVTGVDGPLPEFKSKLEVVSEGEHYILVVEPTTTVARVAATFKIRADIGGKPTSCQAFAIVR